MDDILFKRALLKALVSGSSVTLSSLISTSNTTLSDIFGKVDDVETLLTQVDGHVDGLESDLQSLLKYDVSRLDSFDSFITVTAQSAGVREFDVVGLPSIDVGNSYSVLFYLPSLTGTGDAGIQILNTGSAVYCCHMSNGDIFVSSSDARPIHDIGDISGMNKSFCCKVVFTRIA